ncbi:FUSC family protein [Micromonospora azadirachtae]|uniref:FUSC family protein n=1 Tax=Micromonospora azadirachtae TaxID=1970735 RepID=A0ABW2ZZV4_9ACTN
MTDDRPDQEPERSPLGMAAERSGKHLRHARRRGGEEGKARMRQLEVILVIAVQAGLAAALATLIAQKLFGSGMHVFAPAAAVATIASAIGQRARRTFELLGGVGLGIVIGDLLRFFLGTGAWQTGLVVGLAIATALLVAGRGGALVGQAGGTAVLISTLTPAEGNLELPRIFDALIGGGVGLVVVVLLLPVNPIRVLDRAASPVFSTVADQLGEIGVALRHRDAERSIRALERVRGLEGDIGRLNEAMSGAEEVVTLAPARWHRRRQFHRYARSLQHVERLALNVRVMARRSATAIQYKEPIPDELPGAFIRLSESVLKMREECRLDDRPDRTRALILESADLVGRAWAQGVHSFGDTLTTDLRASASDLLRATGYEPADANRLVRAAAGAGQRSIRPLVHHRLHRAARRNFSTRDTRLSRRSSLRTGKRATRMRSTGRPGRSSPAR